MNQEPWYGVRCYFRHGDPATKEISALYEERIVLIHASSFEEAIEKAEREAVDYISSLDNAIFLEAVDAYQLIGEKITDGTEVYSLMRESDYSDDEYLDLYHHTGRERTK